VLAPDDREAARLPADYESARQRYQLFVPPTYRATRAWPLVLFVSPGDDPLGWPPWQKVCEERDLFFCAAYGAGNASPPGPRIRLVLDVLDDVRRRYRIDPARTYLAGFGGGARLACGLAFALPEYAGGVLAVSGGGVPQGPDYLRHRAQDRLSAALVSGADDFDRREAEVFLAPLLADLGVRTRLWLVPRTGHEMPPPAVVAEALEWLEADLPRRLQDARDRPGLVVASDEVPTRRVRSERMLEAARADLLQPDRVYRGTALLLGVLARGDRTDAADQARTLLHSVREDAQQLERLTKQGGAEELRVLAAQARALDRFGEAQAAREAWEHLAHSYPDTPEGVRAAGQARRLADRLAARPYLGVQFEGETTVVAGVVPHGPAARAGLRPGDQVVKLGDAPTTTPAQVRTALEAHKPGDKVGVQVRRAGGVVTLTVEVGTPPPPRKDEG
jgi:hypothetical protein